MTDSPAAPEQTLGFQTEVKQLLHLMVHSLYSNREIFLRELISNAADACDKLRFEALSQPAYYEDDPEPRIRIDFDSEARTLTVSDNGIGMSRDEVIANLGTIARSGTAEFLRQLTGDQQQDARLIGQFGVGFYSAFIVAESVEVRTRRAGLDASEGVRWVSAGEGEYTIAPLSQAARGTEIRLQLKEDAAEFADAFRLRHLVRTYSDHIGVPVQLPKPAAEGESEGEDAPAEADATPAWETVNSASALWTRPASEISDEEYREFYKHVSHDWQAPLAWTHNKVEGKLEYTSLLYLPASAPFDLWQRDGVRGLKLYVQRVFIMDGAEQFLPMYLRFVKGVLDSADLPLNVSRELLQQNPATDSIRKALTKRALDTIERLAKQEPAQYATFWTAFGAVLKEGPGEDPANAERIARLLRFNTTRSEGEAADRSLDDYLREAPAGESHIYYVLAETAQAARQSPHLEVFRQRGIEVLLLGERVDAWLTAHLHEYEGKTFKDITDADLPLEADEDEASPAAPEGLIERLQAALGERVESVRVSRRLVESPSCLVRGADELNPQLRELLKASGQEVPGGKPLLEVNPEHALLRRLAQTEDEAAFDDLAVVLLEQARLAAGEQPAEPAEFVRRVNRLLAS
ncbi:MAG TPA: molecular chaperone HtpG [Gammaproteobacteria bacterium]|nr:molecular chaperone HtpG [Gammaproteobacteria bacterium]